MCKWGKRTVNGNVNVVVLELLERKLLLAEVGPLLLVVDDESGGGLWVSHCDDA